MTTLADLHFCLKPYTTFEQSETPPLRAATLPETNNNKMRGHPPQLATLGHHRLWLLPLCIIKLAL